MEYTVSCNMVNILFVLYPQRDHQRNEWGTEEHEALFVPDDWHDSNSVFKKVNSILLNQNLGFQLPSMVVKSTWG